MCRWTNGKILFTSSKNHSTKIILREYGCGATDSGKPNYKVCKVKYLSSSFIWVTRIDTTKINKIVWKRIQ